VNTRSLKFQLLIWYAGVLTGCFALLGGASYFGLERWLVGSLKENQLRRARQVAELVREEVAHQRRERVGDEIETRYAPDRNDRFVRVTQKDGAVMYLSAAPKDQSFDPATLPPRAWTDQSETSSRISLGNGRKMLLTAHVLRTFDGANYLIETGAPMDQVQADLRKWLIFLLAMLPIAVAVALGGGSVLVRRALLPVDQIAASAARISSHNLSERLPVAQTGDELQRLSVSLNHMIDRLDAAFQHSRRFVADASHELRTPLTVLKGEMESLVQEQHLNGEWRERLGSVLEEVDRLANIVEGLFAISRLDAGEAAAEWVKFDLAKMAASTADQMSLLADDKNIRVACATEEGVWVEGDRARMKQVVVNLLDNAIKYTPRGGSVALAVSSEDSKAVLEVTDNGLGIPRDALPRVFERFFRVDKSRTREQGGAGLGLSIVKSICTAHQGKVEARSTLGEGSRFRIELPLASPPSHHHGKQHNHDN